MQSLWTDLCYALRMLRRSPGFTAATLLCLALGVGANTAVFSVVNAVLLRPLPFHEPDRLAEVYETVKGGRFTVCPADFQDWREQVQSFESLAAYQAWTVNLTGTEEPERLTGVKASGDLFRLLGVKPIVGRVFLPEDERQRARVVVVSHSLWQRRFGGDPMLVGRSLTFDGESYLVVGVMPPEFQFPSRNVEVWTPLALTPGQERGEHSLWVVGRLRPAVSFAQARAELGGLMRRLAQQFPVANAVCGPI